MVARPSECALKNWKTLSNSRLSYHYVCTSNCLGRSNLDPFSEKTTARVMGTLSCSLLTALGTTITETNFWDFAAANGDHHWWACFWKWIQLENLERFICLILLLTAGKQKLSSTVVKTLPAISKTETVDHFFSTIREHWSTGSLLLPGNRYVFLYRTPSIICSAIGTITGGHNNNYNHNKRVVLALESSFNLLKTPMDAFTLLSQTLKGC